jgi:hypothetical protein
MSRLRSRSSKSCEYVQAPAASAVSLRRLARPRTIRRSVCCPSFSQTARPLSIRELASVSISRRVSRSPAPSGCAGTRRLARQARVQEIRGLPHGAGVVPCGGLKMRFSTCPSERRAPQAPVGGQGHEIDMLDRRLVLRRKDQACALRRGGQGGSNAIEHPLDIGGVRIQRLSRDCGHPCVRSPTSRNPSTNRRRPSCVGTRPATYAGCPEGPELQVLHHVAHRRRRHLFRQRSGQRARTDRRAGVKIALDHPAKHLARAVVEFLEYAALFSHRGALECRVKGVAYKVIRPCDPGGCGLCLAQAIRRVLCVLPAGT